MSSITIIILIFFNINCDGFFFYDQTFRNNVRTKYFPYDANNSTAILLPKKLFETCWVNVIGIDRSPSFSHLKRQLLSIRSVWISFESIELTYTDHINKDLSLEAE